MACTPKQMGEAILRNLEAKTGHPLAHWQQLLLAADITDKKDAISFLKQKHGLGHFQAQKVFEANAENNVYADEAAQLAV